MAERIELLLRVRHHPYDREGEEPTHFSIICEETTVGTIYLRTNLAGDDVPWFWAINMNLTPSRIVPMSGREATREAAMRAFRRSFEVFRNEMGAEGWAQHIEHIRWLRARGG
ncbi:MAG: hypothetical protein DI527_00670 [Chelatococcus sp.]|nr:MAG: hypothetical protein DI527_00670 [Chelatococcus sp.]